MYSLCMAASYNIEYSRGFRVHNRQHFFKIWFSFTVLYMEDCRSKADAALLIDITTEKCFALLLTKKDKEWCACWHGLISAAALGSYVS